MVTIVEALKETFKGKNIKVFRRTVKRVGSEHSYLLMHNRDNVINNMGWKKLDLPYDIKSLDITEEIVTIQGFRLSITKGMPGIKIYDQAKVNVLVLDSNGEKHSIAIKIAEKINVVTSDVTA